MENNILDQEQTQYSEIKYAGFWERVGASLIDFLIFLPVYGLSFYNSMNLKNLVLALVLGFVFLIYKIYMEGVKGATIGKRVMHIVVINEQNEKATMNQVIARNSLYILNTLVGIFSTVLIFNAAGFEDATTFMEISTFQQQNGSPIGTIVGVIVLISVIVVAFDKHKQALHDKIGKTYCAIRE